MKIFFFLCEKLFLRPTLMRRCGRELQDTCEVIVSIPSPGGTKAQHPALPQHHQPSINRSPEKRTDATKIIPGPVADHSQSRRV